MSKIKIESLLAASKPSVLIIEHRRRENIVVGVPHHAPGGTDTLPCPEHRASDENTGYLGYFLAEKLNCCSIIACNYTTDVNKCLHSDYSMQIAKWRPAILVEIHGHAGGIANQKVIEISCGSEARNELSVGLARKLGTLFSKSRQLKNISVIGDFRRLHFQATKSATITDHRWIPYHLELPPMLRNKGATKKPPKVGFMFCETLAKALTEIHN